MSISYRPVKPPKMLRQEMAARGAKNLKCFESESVFPSGCIFLCYSENPSEVSVKFEPLLTISVLQVINYSAQAIAPSKIMIDEALRAVGWKGRRSVSIGENKIATITRPER